MTNAAPDPPLALDEQLCFAVYAAGHALTRAYRELLRPYGLTYPQYLVLLVLWQTDDLAVHEPAVHDLAMKDVGARLGLDSGTLTPLLKRLEAAGYVVRARDRSDERQVRIALSEGGRTLRDGIGEVRVALACRMGLDTAEIGRLTRDLAGLRARLDGPGLLKAGLLKD